MVPGHGAGVLYGEVQAALIAEDGLVLRAVVLKGPVDVFHFGAEIEVEEEDDELHHALQQVPHPHGGVGEKVEQGGGGQGGQDDEQGHGKDQACQHGHAGDPVGQGLFAKAGLDPGLKLAFGFFLVFGVKLRRPGQGLDAHDQGADEADDPAEKGDAQDGVVFFGERAGLFLNF